MYIFTSVANGPYTFKTFACSSLPTCAENHVLKSDLFARLPIRCCSNSLLKLKKNGLWGGFVGKNAAMQRSCRVLRAPPGYKKNPRGCVSEYKKSSFGGRGKFCPLGFSHAIYMTRAVFHPPESLRLTPPPSVIVALGTKMRCRQRMICVGVLVLSPPPTTAA